MKFLRTFAALGVFLLFAGPSAGEELVNGIEAVVDASVITVHDVESLNQQTYEALVRQYRSEPSLLEKKLAEMRDENLTNLVDRQLILRDFKQSGYSLPETVLDELVQDQIKQDFGDRATLTKTLEARGVTIDKFRQQIRERFIVTALRNKNISSEIIISPHKVENYYLAHKDDFNVEDQVKLRVIVLKATADTNAPPAEKMAEEIYLKLREGAAFQEMATLYSQGSQRNQGGEWGWWERSQLTKGLADVAYSLSAGKFSGVFSRTPGDNYWVYLYDNGQPTTGRHYGLDAAAKKQTLLEERRLDGAEPLAGLPAPQEFYLMQVDDTRPAHFKPLPEVREQIEKNLLLEERDRLERQWLGKLWKKTFVRRF